MVIVYDPDMFAHVRSCSYRPADGCSKGKKIENTCVAKRTVHLNDAVVFADNVLCDRGPKPLPFERPLIMG